MTYGTHDETGALGSTNLVKPIYHVGWLASRLDLSVVKPLAGSRGHGRTASSVAWGSTRGAAAKPVVGRGLVATLSDGRAEVASWSDRSCRARRPGPRSGSSCWPSGADPSCGPT